jgi:hypothetical protein
MKDQLPPLELSRSLLFLLVAAGALVSVVSAGRVSLFAAGFAVGAGSALLLSRLRRSAGESRPEETSENS